MGSDQLIELLSQVAYKLIPVAALVLIIFIIVCVKNLIITLRTLNKTLETAEETVKKLDKPLQTVGDISESVDRLHFKARDTMESGLNAAKESFGVVKDKVSGINNPKHAKPEVKVEEVIVNEKRGL